MAEDTTVDGDTVGRGKQERMELEEQMLRESAYRIAVDYLV